MASILPLILALAATPATPAPEQDASTLDAAAFRACEALPLEQQRACVEPLLDKLPPEQAEMLLYATDPATREVMRAWEAAVDGAIQAHARALAARGTPRDQLAAVLAWPMSWREEGNAQKTLPGEVRGWFAQARAARPADPLVAWIEATDCGVLATDCDRAAALDRLLAADPGNAVAHLLAALRTDDPAAMRAHVARAAAAPRFEPYDQQVLELMFAAHQAIDWPRMPDGLARIWTRALNEPASAESLGLARMSGFWMAMVNPMFNIGFCTRLEDSADSSHRANCTAVLEMMARDPHSVMHHAMALPSLVRLTAGTDAAAHWREQLRQHYWVLEKGLGHGIGFGSPVSGSEFLALRATEGEVAALHTLMRRIGEPVEAPPGWLPDEPHRLEALGVPVP